VAVNCSVWPAATDGAAGVTEIDVNTGAVTATLAEPVTEPEVAVIVVVPGATLVANPPLLTVAIVVADEVQVTVLVRFCVVPLLYVPVAVNCCFSPAGTDGDAGATEIDVNTAAVTVNVAEPWIVPDVALIVAVPFATPVASPPLLTVAIVVADEVQVTVLVRFCVVPLLYVPVAVNCCVYPAATDAVPGVTAIEANTGAVTVNMAEPWIVPEVAAIVVVP
jgi:hypothetical protein